MSYLNALYSLGRFHRKLAGINSTYVAAELLGNPQDKYNTIQIAGTNGKGSTALKIAHALQAKGLKVGMFTSPHLFSFRERFQINQVPIPQDAAAHYTELLLDLTRKKNIELSFFQVCTMIAFMYFEEETVDWAVIEAGLGGLRDATNIIRMPRASVITSIGYDHMSILGSTLEQIATHKAGIIKPHCPVVLSPSAAEFECFRKAALANDCEFFEVPKLPPESLLDEENVEVARWTLTRALKLHYEADHLRDLLKITPPLRFKILSETERSDVVSRALQIVQQKQSDAILQPCSIVIDVGHNVSSFARFFEDIKRTYPNCRFRFCLSLSYDKNINVLEAFVNSFTEQQLQGIHFLPAANHRSMVTEDFTKAMHNNDLSRRLRSALVNGMEENYVWLKNMNLSGAFGDQNNPDVLKVLLCSAVAQATEEGSVLVILGSFYMMKDVIECLGLEMTIEPDEYQVVEPLKPSDDYVKYKCDSTGS